MHPINLCTLCNKITLLGFVLLTTGVIAAKEPTFEKPPKVNPLPAVQEDLQEKVLELFDNKCAFAGCHTGATAPKNLDLSEEMMMANLVGIKSAETPFLRVKPGDPDNSYLIKKLRGTPDIQGERMPRGKPLSEEEIATVEAWIKSLPAGMKTEAPKQKYAHAFPGWTLANLPTTEMIEKGTLLFRISHRFNALLSDGYDGGYGLDNGAVMMLHLGFPITENMSVILSRSNFNKDVELAWRGRLLREKTDRAMPISLAVQLGVNWESRKNPEFNYKRTNSEAFHYYGQLVLAKQLAERFSVAAVPGILLNGNSEVTDEEALIAIGVGARVRFYNDLALFGEWVPIVSGYSGPSYAALVSGNKKEGYDSFSVGLEKKIGGHVFQIFLTNTNLIATDQYMNGTATDTFKEFGDFRIGFNIYRVLMF
ncbi:MAG: DUF5777 family beta-barrel protein [candidate division KSB1 bacterium]|nr:DUF5777 family beta-barrel protein [candidate division KSB1 bacterium]